MATTAHAPMTLDQDTYQDELEMLCSARMWRDAPDARAALEPRIADLLVRGGGWGMTKGPRGPDSNEYGIPVTSGLTSSD